jgi:hypothetical protein
VPARAFVILGVFTAAQLMFGALAAFALFAAGKRASRRAFWQILAIVLLVESFLLAAAISAVNAALGGSDTVSAWLLWYAAIGWIVVQVLICVWWYWAWRTGKRERAAEAAAAATAAATAGEASAEATGGAEGP